MPDEKLSIQWCKEFATRWAQLQGEPDILLLSDQKTPLSSTQLFNKKGDHIVV